MKVTILIPNYKTPALTQLCLRLLYKNTDLTQTKIIVIDNDSNDESLAYLKTLNWITLIERKPPANETPALSHARALDLGLAYVDTPYVLSIHTDTLIRTPQWLPFLLQKITADPNLGGVGSWKLETNPWFTTPFKRIEYYLQKSYYAITKNEKHSLAGVGKNFYYLRSHCALYRMDLIQKFALHFAMQDENENTVAGKQLHKKLEDEGYRMLFIPSAVLLYYLDHINHATMVLNPELGTTPHSVKKGLKRIKKRLAAFQALLEHEGEPI